MLKKLKAPLTVTQTKIILLLSGLNLLVMHYYLLFEHKILWDRRPLIFLENFLSVIFDVALLFLLFYYITLRKKKVALTLTFTITLLWSFCNVLYSRFFHHYITLSAIGQTGNLFDWQMFRYMLQDIQWFDIYYLLSLLCFLLCIRRMAARKISIRKLLILLLLTLPLDIASLTAYTIRNLTGKQYLQYHYDRHFAKHHLSPNKSCPFDVQKGNFCFHFIRKETSPTCQKVLNHLFFNIFRLFAKKRCFSCRPREAHKKHR